MIGEQIIDYLVSESFGTKGTDLFLGFMPESPNNVTVIRDGTATQIPESQMYGMFRTGVQVSVRDTNQLTARNKCVQIYEYLRTFRLDSFTDDGNIITMTICTTPPNYIGPDDKNRHTWTCYFDVQYQSLIPQTSE